MNTLKNWAISLFTFFRNRYTTFMGYSRKKKIAIVGGTTLAILIIIPVATYAYYARTIADPERLMNHNNTGVALLDKNGEVFYSRGVVKNIKRVSLNDISIDVQEALIASEDKNFYTDPGFSISGMARAMFTNVTSADLKGSGGSGITQQLVKNNLLTDEKSYLRKYQELAMALAIERQYTKQEILELYLNSVYFGNDSFGIEMAAQTYFGKPAKELDLAQSAILIGLLPAPSAYSPTTGDVEMAEKRQAYVLGRMAEEKYITEEEKLSAEAQQLSYAAAPEEAEGYAQHFALMVIDELNKKYGEERVTRSGFRVKTSLDSNWQKQAEKAVAAQVAKLSAQGARNASLVAVDPKNGEIRALVGSADWSNTEYGKVNMATAARQPGSSFKPIYFAQAIDQKKITAATLIRDEATDFGGGYKPTNYDFKYRGDVTTRYALANSLNIPAVKVLEKVGVDSASENARKMGISTINDPDTYGLSLALGTAEARLTEMTNAYAAFANNGDQFSMASIVEIEDKFKKKVFVNNPKAKRVIGREASYIMSSILSDEQARAPLTGNRFNIGRPAAVKTGTTNDNRDAWTIGYTPQIVIGVWVGNNDNTPMKGVGGSLGAGPIWRSTITSFMQGQPTEQFSQPSGIVRVSVCKNTTGSREEIFIRGTENEFKCESNQEPTVETKPPEEESIEEVPEDEPKKPEKPKKPEEPTNPEEPTEPEEPTNPEEPTEPEEPTNPEEPTEPTNPGGSNPTQPTTP